MYLFSRRARLRSADAVGWASEICARCQEVAGQEVQLWGNAYSPAFGTVTWTSWFADLPSLEAFGDKMQVDPGYVDLVRGADHVEGVVDDGLLQIVFGEPDADANPQYVTGVQAVCAGGAAMRAMTLGAEIAGRASAITGRDTLFARSLTGPYGGVAWLTGHPDIASLEAAEAALAADPGWGELIDSTVGAYVEEPAATQSTLYRRLA